jgi:uncharacterized membrane protein
MAQLHGPTVLAILGMGAGTFATRAGGYWLFSRVRPAPWVSTLLSYVPGCLFVSYVVPAVLAGGLKEWVGTAVALVTVRLTGSVIWPIFTGTAAVWLLWVLLR